MPIYDEQLRRPGPRVVVSASVVIELEWIMHAALREDFRADQPALRALFDAHPELVDQVSELWSEEGQTSGAGFAELVLVADHGGRLLGEDADSLLAKLPALCATVPTGLDDHPMRAETPEDRSLVLHRLGMLRRSAPARRRFVAVVRNLWAAARDDWDLHGRKMVAAAIGRLEAQLAKGADWRDLTRCAAHFEEVLERLVDEMGPSGEIVVVPAYFAHLGMLYDLGGRILVGVKPNDPALDARARTEALARQLQAISEPTRLAIVDSLRSGPKTVTELASQFGLAQPTVSNHVKLLRASGIVADVREGSRRNLVVQNEVVEVLLRSLVHVLQPTSSTAPDRA